MAIGLIAGGMAHARRLERLELDSVVSVPLLDRTFFAGDEETATGDPYAARVGMVVLRGSFTVASSHKLVSVIGLDIKDHEVVIFDFSGTTFIDDSAAMVMEQLMDLASKSRTECIAMGLSGSVASILQSLHVLKNVPENQMAETLDDARRIAKGLLRVDDPPQASKRNRRIP